MRPKFTFVVVFLLALSVSALQGEVFAVHARTVSVSDAEGKAGRVIATTVEIDDLTDVAGASIILLYDETILSVDGVEPADLLTGTFAILDAASVGDLAPEDLLGAMVLAVNTDVAGTISIVMAGVQGAESGVGAIFDLRFKAADGISATVGLTLESVQLYDESSAEIPVETADGSIVVVGPDVSASGKLAELGITTFMYGTHGLFRDNSLIHVIQSSTLDLNEFVDQGVSIQGVQLHPGLDGGPPLIDVLSVKILGSVVREHTPDDSMLALQATYNEANVHGHTYIDIWKGNMHIEPGMFLEFQATMFSGNPTFRGTVDLHTSDGSNLRDSGAEDQNGVSAHPAADLSEFARDQWYHRIISLDALAGKTLDGAMIATDSDEHLAGIFRVYVDNIQITDGEYVLAYVWGDAATEGTIPITGSNTATGTNFGGTSGMSDYSVTIVGETSVNPSGKLVSSWGSIKRGL